MNRTALYLIGALGLIAGLGVLAWRANGTLTGNLPPRIECRDEADARAKAGPGALAVLGTGSMSPFIPPARVGLDPRKTIVALVVMEQAATFDLVTHGDLCIYYPAWHAGPVLHLAAMKDSGGWIMSGLGNARSEPSWRVTASNFGGIVARVYIWPQ